MSVWFITGASRGLGLDIAKAALRRGDQVVATARDPGRVTGELGDADPNLLVSPVDVTSPAQIDAAVAAALERFGRIDVLVNNAGRGMVGAVEEASDAEVREVYEVNVFGLLAVTRAVLPVLRRQRSGKVINISSVVGFVTGPGWGVYASTKFAVEALSEGMGHELAPLGIQVTAIEPGAFRTSFLDGSSLLTQANVVEDYAPTSGAARQWARDNNYGQSGDPAKAARVIVGLADLTTLPERIQLGSDAYHRIADKVARTRRDMDQWREVSVSTAYHP